MSSSGSSDTSLSDDETVGSLRKRLTSTPRTPLFPREAFPEINTSSKPHRSSSVVRFQDLKIPDRLEGQRSDAQAPQIPTALPTVTQDEEAETIPLQSPSQLAERIESLENQLRDFNLSRPSSSWDKGDDSSERTGLNTEIQWMTWQDYLEDASRATNILEVLTERPHTNSRRKSLVPQPSENPQRLFTKTPTSPLKNIERIRIRSFHIINALQVITEQTYMTSSRLILHRPFKVLLFYHDQILDYLKELEQNFTENTRCPLGKRCNGYVDLADTNVSPKTSRSTRSNSIQNAPRSEPMFSPGIKSATWMGSDDSRCKHELSEELLAQAEAITHLRILVKFMQEDMEDVFAKHKVLRSSNAERIAFQDLWHLFMAGDLLVADGELSGNQGPELYQVSILPAADFFSSRRPVKEISTKTEGSHKLVESVYKEEANSAMSVFAVDVFYFDFDGQRFGPVERRMHLVSYEGEKNIVDLPLYPLRFHKDAERFRAMMLERGNKFRELSTANEYPHREYNGLSVGEPQEQVRSITATSVCILTIHALRLTARLSSILPWPTKNTPRMLRSLDLDLGSRMMQGLSYVLHMTNHLRFDVEFVKSALILVFNRPRHVVSQAARTASKTGSCLMTIESIDKGPLNLYGPMAHSSGPSATTKSSPKT